MGFRYLDRLASEDNVRAFLELADLAAGDSSSAQNVFLLSHRLRDSAPMLLCRPYDASALRALPKGRLGHTYATILDTLGYDINFYPKPEFYNKLESDADYINYRVYATHDLHHILSGFSLDNFGELGVISISVAQFSHPGLAFTDLIALLLQWLRGDTPMDELDTPEEQARTAAYAFGRISQGLEMGLAARPLFPVLWDEQMHRDLEELRAELGIEAVREGPWSWHSDATLQAALAA